MGHGIFGWDLPPGVSINDIPGNRPEDDAWDKIYDNFWDKERLTKNFIGTRITEKEYEQMDKLYNSKLSEVIDSYIMAAIEYGIDIGEKQSTAYRLENEQEEKEYRQEVKNPKLIAYFKAQRQLRKDLYKALLSALGSLVALGIKDHLWGQGILDNIQKVLNKVVNKEG